MTAPRIILPDEAEPHLDWLGLVDALTAAHALPKAQVADSFLEGHQGTLLNRSAAIKGLGFAVKSATVCPDNPKRGVPAVNGAVTLYSDRDGRLEALVDFHLVTKWKTAADSLMAARLLAPPRVARILIVGAGTVATSLVQAYRAGFPGARIAVWNRTAAGAKRLCDTMGTEHAPDLPTAVAEADIISCATLSTVPILQGAWLRPGQHLDLIGAFRPDMREADDLALQRARIFVDSFDTTVDHIGELKIPLSNGVIQRGDILADYYDLERFTRAPEDITLFKNGGGAHLDLMTSRYILAQCGEQRG